MNPTQVNALSDDSLRERVRVVANSLDQAVQLPALVPFMTYGLLLRVHADVVAARSEGSFAWSKQAMVAQVMASLTGAPRQSKADCEYIGNAVDYRLRHFKKDLDKAKQAAKKSAQRARKQGRDSPVCARVSALLEKLYVCEFGGTPFKVPCVDGVPIPCRQLPLHRQPVPYRASNMEDVMQYCSTLQAEKQARDSMPSHVREMEHQVTRALIAADKEREQRVRAEVAASEQVAAMKTENSSIKRHLDALNDRVTESQRAYQSKEAEVLRLEGKLVRAFAEAAEEHRKRLRVAEAGETSAAALRAELAAARNDVNAQKNRVVAAERSRDSKEAEVLRLEGKLVRAFAEAAEEHRQRMRVAEASESAAAALRAELDAARNDVNAQKHRVVAAERSCESKEAEVLRLEGKLVRAFAEAAEEHRQRMRVAEAGESAAAALRAELDAAKFGVNAYKEQVLAAERACQAKVAEVMRLEGKLALALIETASAQSSAEKANARAKSVASRLTQMKAEYEERLQHTRKLKAQMAERARLADRRASTADELAKELNASREKLRQLKKQITVFKIDLNIEKENRPDEVDESDDDVAEDSDSDSDCSEAEKEQQHQLHVTKRNAEDVPPQELISSMPTWRAHRGKGAGRGAPKLEWGTRLTIYMLLALLVPPASIGMVIVAIVMRTAPWLRPSAPTPETVKRCRFELRFFEEALAARRVACAHRIRGIGFDETTKLGNNSLTSNVTIEPREGAPFEDVILRAAYCPLGCTSDLIVQSIERKCFERLRGHLRKWKAQFQSMFPQDAWTGPEGAGGAIMSDTCNAARKAKQLLAELVAEQVKESLGEDVCAQMSAEELAHAARVHPCDCSQHLRNIFLAEMSRAQAQHVEVELQPELSTFAAWERMSTSFDQLVRAAFKEFHHSCRYYKGQGRPFAVWLREVHPTSFTVHLERADGGRQDLDYDAAIPLYINRPFFVEFLHDRVYQPKHRNILEDFLYIVLTSTQYIAMIRANAIIDILISRPLRWLSGKSKDLVDWSPFSIGEAFDAVEQFLVQAQHDGSMFLDDTLDLFASIADKQPAFAAWRHHTFNTQARLAPDGKTKHLLYRRALDELLHPTDSTNAASEQKVIEYLEVQAAAAVRKLHDPKLALRDKLSSQDGVNSVRNAGVAHSDTIGCQSTNDTLAESVFGTFDMVLKRFQGISMEAASGVSQAVRSKVLSLGDHVARRKQSTKVAEGSYVGYVHSLPEKELQALVECSRLTMQDCRASDRADHAELDAYHKHRRKMNEEDELDALFTRYALALSFFERWQKRGVENVSEMMLALRAYGDREQEKLDWLREQIEMRVVGLSWNDVKTPWSSSSNENIGTVAQLSAHLKDEILVREAALRDAQELPDKNGTPEDNCPAPLLQRKTFKTLGTPTVQADELCMMKIEPTSAEKLEGALARRKELEERGEIDWVSDRQPYPTGQGPTPDKRLLGKKLEVRWRYFDEGRPIYIWCEGDVVQVADGEKDKLSQRCKKLLPAGALRIKWPADTDFDEDESFVWSILKPCNFNRDTHLGWRFASSELLKMQESSSSERRNGNGKAKSRHDGKKS